MRCPISPRLSFVVSLVVACPAAFAGGWAAAQTAPPAVAVPAPPTDQKKLPAPEEGSVVTKDGVKIVYTYLPGTSGKDSIPVILLHMFKGNRHEMDGLGLSLQKLGHAVIIPDLRGHGDSTTVAGYDRPLDASTMPIQHFGNMVSMDLESLKKFIIERNNAGALNVDKLCVIGAEMGAAVAVNWAAQDWSYPPLASLKQGQDVKALVLLSPQMAFKPSLSLTKALAYEPVRKQVSFFLIAGAEDVVSARDARRIAEDLERARRPDRPDKPAVKSVFLMVDDLKTKLVGTKLLGEQSLGVEAVIGEFLQLQVVDLPAPWKERKMP